MKALLIVLVSVVTLFAMGGSLYWIFQKAPQYQAESAQSMKTAFLAKGDVEVATPEGQVWTFPATEPDWNFSVQGGLLTIQPPMPSTLPTLDAGQKFQDLAIWPEIQKLITEQVRSRLGIDFKSRARLEILPPAASATPI